ncbi:MAG: hypothetical protein ACKON7_05570, partial [Planctomycetaceae bacterium]
MTGPVTAAENGRIGVSGQAGACRHRRIRRGNISLPASAYRYLPSSKPRTTTAGTAAVDIKAFIIHLERAAGRRPQVDRLRSA